MYETLKDCLPNDHADQVTSHYYIEKLMQGRRRKKRTVLDLGCGTGSSVDVFRKFDKSTQWVGLDIEESPEVAQRKRTDAEFQSYDGVHIPFDDNHFDIIYSHQVFEHVRHPDKLLAEIKRTLKPGGAFIGSVSSLEPYHSFSYWNYTPFGWHVLLTDVGLKPVEFRPGIDGVSLIQRSYRGRPAEANGWWTLSPINQEIDSWGKSSKRRPALINLRKLTYCGHLVFHATA